MFNTLLSKVSLSGSKNHMTAGNDFRHLLKLRHNYILELLVIPWCVPMKPTAARKMGLFMAAFLLCSTVFLPAALCAPPKATNESAQARELKASAKDLRMDFFIPYTTHRVKGIHNLILIPKDYLLCNGSFMLFWDGATPVSESLYQNEEDACRIIEFLDSRGWLARAQRFHSNAVRNPKEAPPQNSREGASSDGDIQIAGRKGDWYFTYAINVPDEQTPQLYMDLSKVLRGRTSLKMEELADNCKKCFKNDFWEPVHHVLDGLYIKSIGL